MPDITGYELGAQARLAKASQEKIRPERFERIQMGDFPWCKPYKGGLWTSTYDPTFCCDWYQWCHSEMPERWRSQSAWVWLIQPEDDAHIFQIHTLDDLKELIERFPAENNSGLKALGNFPDWKAIEQVYDGVNLTEEGQWATRLSDPNLYGWDCESTLWLNWAFKRVRHIGKKKYAIRSYEEEEVV
jgi:hypothetical protein